MVRLRVFLLSLAVVPAIAACGSTTSPNVALPPPTTRHHAVWTITLKWATPTTALKVSSADLRLNPVPRQASVSGTLAMKDMSMPPETMHWHQIKPGNFSGSAIATMAGQWLLHITIHAGGTMWTETYPVTVSN